MLAGIQSSHKARPRKPFIIVWFLLVFLMLVSLFGFYKHQSQAIKEDTHHFLQSASEAKVAHIESWLEERQRDIFAITQQDFFVKHFLDLKTNPEYQARMKERLQALIKVHGYGRISLLDEENTIISDLGELKQPMPEHTKNLIESTISTWMFHSQLFWHDGIFHYDAVTPILDHTTSPVIHRGSIVFHVDPSRLLVPLIEYLPLQWSSGKSELLYPNEKGGYQVLAASVDDMRFKASETLVGSGPFEQLDNHSSNEDSSLLEYVNSKGQKILAYHQHLTDEGWVLLTSVTQAEVMAPLYRLLAMMALIGVLVLLLVLYKLNRVFSNERARLKTEQLESSQKYFMGLFMEAPIAYQSLSTDGLILDVNQAWLDLFGYQRDEVLNQPYSKFIQLDSMATLEKNFPILLAKGVANDVPFNIVRKDGSNRSIRLQGRISVSPITGQTHTHCVLNDVTMQLKAEHQQVAALKRTEALLDIMLDAPSLDEQGLLEEAMNRVEALTNSQIGFVHFVSEDQNEIQLATWSTNTLNHYCTANYDNHYPVDQAGIWADCVRHGKSTVVNDYQNETNKNGLPEGHSELNRFVSVPIFYKGLVRMIIGVGNAPQPYNDYDVESIQLFGGELYQMVLLKRAYSQLELSEKRFHHLFEKAPFPYQSLDKDRRILEVNEAWLALFGLNNDSKPEVLGKLLDEFVSSTQQAGLEKDFAALVERGQVNNHLFDIIRQDGLSRTVEVTGRTSLTQDGELRTHCILLDVTQKHENEKAIRLAAKVFGNTGEGIMVTDPQRRIVSINDAFTDILGYSEQDVLGKTPAVVKSGKHDERFYQAMWHEIDLSGSWQGEIWNRHKEGHLIPEWLTISEMKDLNGQIENYVGVFADISELKASQAELDYLAHHDILTQLPNRRRFMTNLDYAITHAKRDTSLFAVLMLDLDRFKDVNDSYGHAAGDEVLVNVANLLKQHIREVDMVARLGGDEFVVLLEALNSGDDAARIARNMIHSISEPLTLSDDKKVSVGCSIGITLFPEHGSEPEVLMQHADSALYLAKQKGRGTFEYFASEMTQHAQQRMAIESELKTALKNNELRVFYQPQTDMKTGHVKGAEALVRWQHPEHGLMPPAYFIGIAEESGLIAEIGEWVLNETCRQAKEWHDQGCTHFVYAVNVSPKQLVYTDLFSVVMDALKVSGLPAEQLELEITESGLMSVGSDAVHLFENLRGLGVRIAIDDFGTGYSSLSYLKSLPLDVLKVDKQFVDDIPDDEQGMQIVNTIISMAHNLRLDVLAEGVEEEVQKRFLELRGCNYYQGYLTSPPVAAQEFGDQFLNKR